MACEFFDEADWLSMDADSRTICTTSDDAFDAVIAALNVAAAVHIGNGLCSPMSKSVTPRELRAGSLCRHVVSETLIREQEACSARFPRLAFRLARVVTPASKYTDGSLSNPRLISVDQRPWLYLLGREPACAGDQVSRVSSYSTSPSSSTGIGSGYERASEDEPDGLHGCS